MSGAKADKDTGVVVVEPNEGKTVWLGGVGVVFKLSSKDTGGAFSVVEHPIKPGALVPPHVHTNEDQFSIVLEGKVGIRVGDQVIEATPGYQIFKPRGIPHTFWNSGDTLARLIDISSPGGFEKFFEEVALVFPDLSRMEEVSRKFGTSWWPDWVPELTAKYNLKIYGI